MRVIILILAIFLVSPSLVTAVDFAAQTDQPAMSESPEEVRSYTGIIKNMTNRKVSIPSKNSDATLLILPHSWIEYTIWTRRSDVTAYHNGKPFYCLNLLAYPKGYPFMCKKYDFMAEIVKEEPVIRQGPYKKLKRRIKRRS